MANASGELAAAARLGTSQEAVDALIAESLDALGRLVPFDLATVMQLDGDELTVRVARGRLDGPAVQRHRLSLRRFPSLRQVLELGQARAFSTADHGAGDGDPFDGVLDLPHGHFCMVAPLPVSAGEAPLPVSAGEAPLRLGAEPPLGILTLDRATCGVYPPEIVALVEVFARLLAVAIRFGEQSVRLERVRARLAEQNRLLVEQVGGSDECGRMLEASRSQGMRHVVQIARQIAPTDAPVWITGETGTGKDVLASAIHGWSARADRPLVRVNCAAVPAALIEGELFGHARGATRGSDGSGARVGAFQAAHGGTLFLDEIGRIPPEVQARLVRVLQDGTFAPVGGDRAVRVDVRVIAATNVDLQAAIRAGLFREDLYYRLAVFPVALPPLRARPEDIPAIARSFLEQRARRTGRGPWYLPEDVLAHLVERPWPGNVRELVNTLERATLLSVGGRLTLEPAPREQPLLAADGPAGALPPSDRRVATLEELERAHILEVLRATGGRVHGPGGAAELLGLHPNTLLSRMRRHGLGGARAHRRRPARS